MISWIFLPFLFIQLSDAIKFSDLNGTDLEGNRVSFKKYENKCVLFLQLSPIIKRPQIQVDELNKIYDEYHNKGLCLSFLN